MQKKKFYTARQEEVFKKIFCKENTKNLMMEFLSRILEKKVEQIEFLPDVLNKECVFDKTKIVDVFALVDGETTYIQLNLDSKDHEHIEALYACASFYVNQAQLEGKYNYVSKFVRIDFTYGLDKRKKVKKECFLKSDDGAICIDNFKIIEFNMDQIMNFWNEKDNENIQKYKHLIMLNLQKDELKELSKDCDDFVNQFIKEMDDLN